MIRFLARYRSREIYMDSIEMLLLKVRRDITSQSSHMVKPAQERPIPCSEPIGKLTIQHPRYIMGMNRNQLVNRLAC